MMRLRNSLRCSKNVMVPPGSSERMEFCVLGAESATGLRRMLRILRRFWQIRSRRLGIVFCRRFGAAGHGLADRRDGGGFVTLGLCRAVGRAHRSGVGLRLRWLRGG